MPLQRTISLVYGTRDRTANKFYDTIIFLLTTITSKKYLLRFRPGSNTTGNKMPASHWNLFARAAEGGIFSFRGQGRRGRASILVPGTLSAWRRAFWGSFYFACDIFPFTSACSSSRISDGFDTTACMFVLRRRNIPGRGFELRGRLSLPLVPIVAC